MIPWWATTFGEADIARVSAAIRDRHISQGPVTREFEGRLAERLGVPYVVCCTSGTTALTMTLMAAGWDSWNTVVVPDRTWIATAHAVMMTDARIKLTDTDEFGLMPDVERKTGYKALPVNLNGRLAICAPWDIEDSCQAFPNPPRGLAACYSFSTAKLLPTGQGGAVATRDEGLYRELKALRTHDVEDAMIPQVLKWRRFGYNFRYTDLQAAIGLSQLATLDERIAAIRVLHAEYLRCGVEVMPSPLPLYNEFLHPDPEGLRAHLRAAGIEARPFYPPLHTAPYLNATGEFPNAKRLSKGLFLPSGPAQVLGNIERVAEAIHAYRP